jgi:uncharacterized protein (DUF1499 family)
MNKIKRSRLVILAVVACVLMGFASRLENWKRDLTSNAAQLDADSPDPTLRPFNLPIPLQEAAERTQNWVGGMSRWSVESIDGSEGTVILHVTRRTLVFRFVDDITIQLTEEAGGTRVDAESKSRFGKGDLGQNPRNLRELRKGLLETE